MLCHVNTSTMNDHTFLTFPDTPVYSGVFFTLFSFTGQGRKFRRFFFVCKYNYRSVINMNNQTFLTFRDKVMYFFTFFFNSPVRRMHGSTCYVFIHKLSKS